MSCLAPCSMQLVVNIYEAHSVCQERFLYGNISMKHFLYVTFIYIISCKPLDNPI